MTSTQGYSLWGVLDDFQAAHKEQGKSVDVTAASDDVVGMISQPQAELLAELLMLALPLGAHYFEAGIITVSPDSQAVRIRVDRVGGPLVRSRSVLLAQMAAVCRTRDLLAAHSLRLEATECVAGLVLEFQLEL